MTTLSRDKAASAAPSPPVAPAQPHDPLSDALLYLAAHHGRALSRNALLSGLPITDGHLTVPLLARAAQRAGLEVEPVKRPLADIPALVLPAILIQRDGSMLILLHIDHDKQTAVTIDPTARKGEQTQSFAALEPNYLGYSHSGASRGGRRSARRGGRRPAARALVLVGRAEVLAELRPHRHRGAGHQHAGAGLAALHHERLRSRHPERRDPVAGRARDRAYDRDRLRLPAAHRAQPHHRHDRQEARRRARGEYFRTHHVGENGAAADLDRHPRQPDARIRSR